ncbi:MAG: PaaI family thioesterase [Micromonosporaceae bacterium]
MAAASNSSNVLHQLVADLPVGELIPVPPGAEPLTPGCLLDLFGMQLTHVGRGAARAEMQVQPMHLNQRGNVQGGAIVALADATAGWASYAALPEGRFTTQELNCNLIGRATEGHRLVATATPAHLGRQTMVLDVTVRRADREDSPPGKGLVARFSCTQLVLGAAT